MQDLNGRGEIGIDAVRVLLLVHNMTLNCHVQFKPLWDYLKVRCYLRSFQFSVSFNPSFVAMETDVRVL